MKRYIAGTLALLCAAALTMTSCYKDDSTTMSGKVPEIGTTTPGELSYEFMQEVNWQPVLAYNDGTELVEFTAQDYEKYDYLWRITRTNSAWDTTRVTICEGLALQTIFAMPPNSGGLPYDLGLYMWHKQTGMQHNVHWSVDVSAQLSGGVLVADTRDEQTSDLSLIKSGFYTTTMWDLDYTTYQMTMRPDIIYRDIYSAANQAPFDGLVTSIAYNGNSSYSEVAAVVGGRSLTRMDPVSMQVTERDQEMFYYTPETWNPQTVYSLPQNFFQRMVFINDGRAHFYNPADRDGKYSSSTDQDVNYEIAEGIFIPIMMYSNVYSLYFDKRNGSIIKLNGLADYLSKNADDMPDAAAGSAFDHKALSGFDCLWAGYFGSVRRYGLNPDYPDNYHISIWLMREKSSGKLWMYEFEVGEIDLTGNWDFGLACRGAARFDMSGCMDLDRATGYACSRNYREFYYAVGNKIYSVILTPDTTPAPGEGGALGSVFESFATTDPGEVITHMDFNMCYYTGSVPVPDRPNPIDADNNLMTIATWNATTKEGKVYGIPRAYEGSGIFAPGEFVHEWGGFGRITAICVRE